jgi:hypothetical protein
MHWTQSDWFKQTGAVEAHWLSWRHCTHWKLGEQWGRATVQLISVAHSPQ